MRIDDRATKPATLFVSTPIGLLRLEADRSRTRLATITIDHPADPLARFCTAGPALTHPAILDFAAGQLAEYFLGSRKAFTVPLVIPAPDRSGGIAFTKLQSTLGQVPRGQTVQLDLLAELCNVTSAQAQTALILCKLPVILPTHRVEPTRSAAEAWLLTFEKSLVSPR